MTGLKIKSGKIQTIRMFDGTSVRVGTNSHTNRPYDPESFNITKDLFNTRLMLH